MNLRLQLADIGRVCLAVEHELDEHLAGTETVVDAPHRVASSNENTVRRRTTDNRRGCARRQRQIALVSQRDAPIAQ